MASAFCILCQMEIDELNRHKWIESEKAGHDLGEAAYIDWVERFYPAFARAHAELLDAVRAEAADRKKAG